MFRSFIIFIIILIIFVSSFSAAQSPTPSLSQILIEREESLGRLVTAIEDQLKNRCNCLGNWSAASSSSQCIQPGCGNNFRSNSKFQCVSNFGEDVNMCGSEGGLIRSVNASTTLFAPGTSLSSRSSNDLLEGSICGTTFDRQAAIELAEAERKYGKENGGGGWMGYATVDGASRFFPGFPFNRSNDKCDEYDATLENYYTTASAGPKDIVFLFDVSGSMSTVDDGSSLTRLELMQQAAIALLRTLTPNDFFGIVKFSGNAEIVASGPGNTVLSATESNIQTGITAINALVASGGTYFVPGMRESFKLFKASTTSASSSLCTRILLFLTDGVNSDKSTIMPTLTVEQNDVGARKVKIFSVSMAQTISGTNSADPTIPRDISCTYNGVWQGVNVGDSPLKALAAYYKVLAYGFVQDQGARWAPAGYDRFITTSTGERKKIVTVSRPVYDRSDANKPIFVGAAVLVVPYSDLTDGTSATDTQIQSQMISRSGTCSSTGNPSTCLMQQLRNEAGFECPSQTSYATCQSNGQSYDIERCPNSQVTSGVNQMLCEKLNSTTMTSEVDRGALPFDKVACCLTQTKSLPRTLSDSLSDTFQKTASSSLPPTPSSTYEPTASTSASLVLSASHSLESTFTESVQATISPSLSPTREPTHSLTDPITTSSSISSSKPITMSTSQIETESASLLETKSETTSQTIPPPITPTISERISTSASQNSPSSSQSVQEETISPSSERTGTYSTERTVNSLSSSPTFPSETKSSTQQSTQTRTISPFPHDLDSSLAAPPLDPAKVAVIAGSIAGALVLICLVILLFLWWRRRRMGYRRDGDMDHFLPARKNIQFNLYDEDSTLFRADVEDQMDDRMVQMGLFGGAGGDKSKKKSSTKEDTEETQQATSEDSLNQNPLPSSPNSKARSSSFANFFARAKSRSVSFASNVKDSVPIKPTAENLQDSFFGDSAAAVASASAATAASTGNKSTATSSSDKKAETNNKNQRTRARSFADTEDPDSFFGAPTTSEKSAPQQGIINSREKEVLKNNDSFSVDDYFGGTTTTTSAAATAVVAKTNTDRKEKKIIKEKLKQKDKESTPDQQKDDGEKEDNLDDTTASMDLDSYFKDVQESKEAKQQQRSSRSNKDTKKASAHSPDSHKSKTKKDRLKEIKDDFI